MRKFSLGLALLLACTAILSACSTASQPAKTPEPGGQAAKAPEPGGQAAKKADPVTITYAFWQKEQEQAVRQVIAKFHESHPDIRVDAQIVPWGGYWEKLQTVLAGGEGYDVFWMNSPNFPFYASRDVFLDMTPHLEKEKGNFPQSLLDMYTYNGKLYGVPKDYDTIALFYNQTLFEQAGVPLPPKEWNWKWDDFVATARQLTKDANGKRPGEAGFDAKKIVQFGTAAAAGQTGHYNVVFSNGGWIFSPDKKKSGYSDPATIEAMEKYMDLMHKELVSPGSVALVGGMADPYQLFLSGKVAMYFGGSWMAKTFTSQKEFKVGVTYLPILKQPATVIHGLANVVFKKSKHLKEATTFALFLGSKEANGIFAQSGMVIPAYKGFQDAWVKANPELNASVFINAVQHSHPLPSSAATLELGPVEQDAFDHLWSGKGAVRDILADLAKKTNAALATAR